jgi:hypothetical protein
MRAAGPADEWSDRQAVQVADAVHANPGTLAQVDRAEPIESLCAF